MAKSRHIRPGHSSINALFACAKTGRPWQTAVMSASTYHELSLGPVGQSIPSGPPLRVELAGDRVIVTFVDGSASFLLDWLRDNCPCDVCRVRQTDERRIRPWDLASAPDIAAIDVVNGALVARWINGHLSQFDTQFFTNADLASHRGAHTARMWRAGYAIERFDHDAVVDDLISRRGMFEAFRRDGAVVVAHSPTLPGTCMTFLQSIGITLRDSSLGLIFDVKVDPAGYNVAFTAEGISPHNDNAQYTHPPSGQVLAMLVNDASGGQSIAVDGWSIIDHLTEIDPRAVEVLGRVPIGFRQYSTTAEGYTRAPLIVRDRDGKPQHLRFSNQLMQSIPFDEPDLAEWYRAYRLLGATISDPAFQVRFRLNAGDMLIVHGMRVMHGRDAFAADGPRHLQDIYFDYDDVIGQLDRMTGAATNAMIAE